VPSDSVRAVLFDFSGTLARLEEDDSWFAGMDLDEARQAEVMDRMTHPTADVAHQAWAHRDLDPVMHREAYMHVLRESGLPEPHAVSLYGKLSDLASWTPYPDTSNALNMLRTKGIRTAVVSNIPWDIRQALAAFGTGADEYVLSFEVGVVKPDPRIFEIALDLLGVEPGHTLMVGDSVENDGAARELGCAFAYVDPLPTADRPHGLIDALRAAGVDL